MNTDHYNSHCTIKTIYNTFTHHISKLYGINIRTLPLSNINQINLRRKTDVDPTKTEERLALLTSLKSVFNQIKNKFIAFIVESDGVDINNSRLFIFNLEDVYNYDVIEYKNENGKLELTSAYQSHSNRNQLIDYMLDLPITIIIDSEQNVTITNPRRRDLTIGELMQNMQNGINNIQNKLDDIEPMNNLLDDVYFELKSVNSTLNDIKSLINLNIKSTDLSIENYISMINSRFNLN
jgi:hypothetical protein